MTANNPAGRLLDILQALKNLPGDLILQRCWARIFGLNEEDADAVLTVLADLIKLTEEAKREISKQKVDQALYLRPYAHIQRIYRSSLDAQQSNIREFLNDGVTTGLQFGAELLNRISTEKMLPDEERAKLYQDIQNLQERILTSKIPENIKYKMLENLEEIERAVNLYGIHGTAGIEKAVARNHGSIAYYPKEEVDAMQDPDVRAVVVEYLNFIVAVTTLTANVIVIGSATVSAVTYLLNSPVK